MTRSFLPITSYHGVPRALQCIRTLQQPKVHLRPVSSSANKHQEEEEVDAFNAALDAALQEYDESDPFRGFTKPGTGAKAHKDFVKEETHYERADTDKPSLPLPPFLRRKALDKKRSLKPNIRKHEESLKEFEVPDEGRYTRAHRKSITNNKRVAPFSTLFAQNPWARALGTPVRECRTTSLRLPTSCLIDFHVVAKESQETEEAGYKPQSVQLMPMSLAAALIPTASKYRGYSEEEQSLQRLSRQATLRRKPHGVASYLAAHHSVLDQISKAAPKKESKKFDFTRRFAGSRLLNNILTVRYGDGARLHWREDMADFVLKGLRALVIKRLRYWLSRKDQKGAEGSVSEIVGGSMHVNSESHGGLRGWRGVEMVDDALCVLRLRPDVDAEYSSLNNEESGDDHTIESIDEIVTAASSQAPYAEFSPVLSETSQAQYETQSSESISVGKHTADLAETPDTGPIYNLTVQTIDSQSASPDKTPAAYKQTDSTTYVEPNSAFTTPTRTPSFLLGLMPLPPDRRPSNLYCPTVPYRGRRIPMFDLYFLLGADVTEDLLKDSVFAESQYLAMTSTLGTFNVIGSMSKLMTYISTSKREFFEKIESESRGFASKTTKANP